MIAVPDRREKIRDRTPLPKLTEELFRGRVGSALIGGQRLGDVAFDSGGLRGRFRLCEHYSATPEPGKCTEDDQTRGHGHLSRTSQTRSHATGRVAPARKHRHLGVSAPDRRTSTVPPADAGRAPTRARFSGNAAALYPGPPVVVAISMVSEHGCAVLSHSPRDRQPSGPRIELPLKRVGRGHGGLTLMIFANVCGRLAVPPGLAFQQWQCGFRLDVGGRHDHLVG